MNKLSPKKVQDTSGPVEYKLHLGTIIRELIKGNKALRQTDLCSELHITTTAMQGKLNNPIYGNVYDLVKTSLFLNVDLFDRIRKELVKAGMPLFAGNEEQMSIELVDAKRRINLMKVEIETLEKLAKVREQLK